MTEKRLIFLKQFFDPEPTMKGLAFARALREQGFEVEVVTGFPNYPGGKVYPGYRIRPIAREARDGVAITRLALYPSHDRSRIGRVLNYVSFFLSASLYLTFFARRADVIYGYHPPLTVAMAAGLAGALRRVPVVLDIQDMWPDTLRATGMVRSRGVIGFVGAVARRTWRRATRIVVLSPGFRRLLIERGVEPERITVIRNWADEAAIASEAPATPVLPDDGRFRVLFAGNMGLAQGLDTVLDAAAIVARQTPRVEIVFLGSGLDADRLKARAEQEGLANVRFLPRVPMAEVGGYLVAADVLLVHLKADPLFAITIPSKTQAYMAAGKPVILAVDGDAADIVKDAGCGLTVPPQDPEALAQAILKLSEISREELDRMGKLGYEYYRRELSFDLGVQAFVRVFNQAISAYRSG